MKFHGYYLYLFILFTLLLVSCVQDDKNIRTIKKNIETRSYNFKFIGSDINIDNPERDRRSYYKIYIDKLEAGRTTIGLESQRKTFECKIQSNRHLLMVQKWVLDERKGKYYKLNNIDQPKPNYIYFNQSEDKIVVITLENDILKKRSKFEVDIIQE